MNQESRRSIPAYEATSLTNKFKSLWLAGNEAKLVFETRDGQAWGTLHVCLGEHPLQPPVYPQEHPRKNQSPAKQRRRERREAARVEAAKASIETSRERCQF